MLAQKGSSWKVVGDITITRLPIRLLSTRSHGWRDIGVWVQGGGIRPGYEAELRFNGKIYPNNPSIPPARKLAQETPGTVVLPANVEGALLYQ